MTAGWNPGGKMLAVARAFFLFPVMGLCNLSCCFPVTRDAIRQVFESSFFQWFARRANLHSLGWNRVVCWAQARRAGGLGEQLPTCDSDRGSPALAGEPDDMGYSYNPQPSP